MTYSEIVKALFECSNNGYNEQKGSCRNCPYDGKAECPEECMSMLAKDALNLIKSQQAEVEVLNKEVDRLSQLVLYHDGDVVDAVKEFAALLVSKAKSTKERFLLKSLVESVMKEMGCNDESET